MSDIQKENTFAFNLWDSFSNSYHRLDSTLAFTISRGNYSSGGSFVYFASEQIIQCNSNLARKIWTGNALRRAQHVEN